MDECARMNCDKEAVALLSFAPQQAKAWLYDLHESDSGGGIVLCRKHANATVVPMSWQLVDGRDPAWPGPNQESAVPDPAPQPALVAAVGSAGAVDALAQGDASVPGPRVLDQVAATPVVPVVPDPYTARQAGLVAPGLSTDMNPPAVDADPSLFELSVADMPAVTPHRDFR